MSIKAATPPPPPFAAHETGHAVQHATAYSMLMLRSMLVPVQNASAKIINIIVIASIFGGYFFIPHLSVSKACCTLLLPLMV